MIDLELGGMPHETIVVDNGSGDGTRDFLMECIRKRPSAMIKPIINTENRGISHGKNQGVEASVGEYIFLLDGDIIPIPNSINCLLAWMESHDQCQAIGFPPNKFAREMNRPGGAKHHENYCEVLHNPRVHKSHCIYYGIYRREVFDKVKFCTEGPFGEPGYGWEDFDFYQQMKAAGIEQWVAGINNAAGKYYHAINSSIRSMGRREFQESAKRRKAFYNERWPDA